MERWDQIQRRTRFARRKFSSARSGSGQADGTRGQSGFRASNGFLFTAAEMVTERTTSQEADLKDRLTEVMKDDRGTKAERRIKVGAAADVDDQLSETDTHSITSGGGGACELPRKVSYLIVSRARRVRKKGNKHLSGEDNKWVSSSL